MKKKITILILVVLLIFVSWIFWPRIYQTYATYKIINSVEIYTDLNDLEAELCQTSTEYELISVDKCIKDNNILYRQSRDTSFMTDQGRSIFYNQDGQELCSYNAFGGFDSLGGNYCYEITKDWGATGQRGYIECDWQELCNNFGKQNNL